MPQMDELAPYWMPSTVWDDGDPAKPGWYIGFHSEDGFQAVTMNSSTQHGWFASRSDCERAIQHLTSQGIGAKDLLAATDEEMRRRIYEGLAW